MVQTRRQIEPWDDPQCLEVMCVHLIEALASHGPMAQDLVARYCLTPRELSAVMPAAARVDLAKTTLEALGQFLDEPGGAKPLAQSIRAWRAMCDQSRQRFDWSHFTPAIIKHARRRADFMIDYLRQQEWIETTADGAGWQITPGGRQAIA